MEEEQFRPGRDRREDSAVQQLRRFSISRPPLVKPTEAFGLSQGRRQKAALQSIRKTWRGHLVGDPSLSGERRFPVASTPADMISLVCW